MKISNMLVLKSSDVSSCKFQHLASVDSSNPLPLCDNRKERQREHKMHCNNDWNSGLCVFFFPRFHIFCNTVNGQLCHIRRIICGTDLTERPTAYTHTHTHTQTKNTQGKNAQTRAHHTHTHTHTHTNTNKKHTHASTHKHAHARTNARVPTNTRVPNTHTLQRRIGNLVSPHRIHKQNLDWNFKLIFIQIIHWKVKKFQRCSLGDKYNIIIIY
jgi:hypothetical protein